MKCKQKPLFVKLFATLACLGAMLWGVFQFLERRTHLSYLAAIITNTDYWDSDTIPYQWLSDHTVLFESAAAYSNDPETLDAVRLFDTKKQSIQEIPALRKSFGHFKKFPNFLRVNREGDKLLWGNTEEFVVTSLDGVFEYYYDASKDTIPTLENNTFLWMNNDRIAGLNAQTKMRMAYDITRLPINKQRFALDESLGIPATILPSNQLVFVSYFAEAGWFMHEGVIERIAQPWSDQEVNTNSMRRANTITISDVSLAIPPKPTIQYQFSIPPYAQIQEFTFAPNGRRILWKLKFVRPSNWTFLGRFCPSLLRQPRIEFALWISDSDGSHAHEIGREALPYASEQQLISASGQVTLSRQQPFDEQKYEPMNIRWLPNSNQISFLFGNHLWIMPIK